MRKEFLIRWLFFFIGIMFIGLGIAFTIRGQRFGVGSWDVLHMGLFYHFGLSVGAWSVIIGLLIVLLTAILLKRAPQIGTFMNMIFTGVFLDLFNSILPQVEGILSELGCFILGIIFIGIGCGIYIAANLGAGPRDSLMLLFVEKLRWSITVARTAMEVFAAGVGYLMGGPVGIGTIVMVFALGPIIEIILPISKKVLNRILNGQAVTYK
ncbi:YczE/YyaS/YitT family protein [Kurthia senegalensis]|uniref:YczE/YyaS/YitT family protein n=1 Tax=Kurthia senegalensis TaxID=1033740 RepID=UPI00028904C0|nr:YitT family protein [Kurthia senegalensis]